MVPAAIREARDRHTGHAPVRAQHPGGGGNIREGGTERLHLDLDPHLVSGVRIAGDGLEHDAAFVGRPSAPNRGRAVALELTEAGRHVGDLGDDHDEVCRVFRVGAKGRPRAGAPRLVLGAHLPVKARVVPEPGQPDARGGSRRLDGPGRGRNANERRSEWLHFDRDPQGVAHVRVSDLGANHERGIAGGRAGCDRRYAIHGELPERGGRGRGTWWKNLEREGARRLPRRRTGHLDEVVPVAWIPGVADAHIGRPGPTLSRFRDGRGRGDRGAVEEEVSCKRARMEENRHRVSGRAGEPEELREPPVAVGCFTVGLSERVGDAHCHGKRLRPTRVDGEPHRNARRITTPGARRYDHRVAVVTDEEPGRIEGEGQRVGRRARRRAEHGPSGAAGARCRPRHSAGPCAREHDFPGPYRAASHGSRVGDGRRRHDEAPRHTGTHQFVELTRSEDDAEHEGEEPPRSILDRGHKAFFRNHGLRERQAARTVPPMPYANHYRITT